MSSIYPKRGEKLFVNGDYETNSYIPASINGKTEDLLNKYYNGFKELADAGVEQIIANSHSNAVKDKLVFPIMFNYRHYIELILKKYAIKYANDESERMELGQKLGHNLEFYWRKVKPLLIDVYSAHDNLEEISEATESYILQFQELDRGSFTFRYPFAKGEKFAPFFNTDFHIDTVHLRDKMNELYNLLEYMEDVIEHKGNNKEDY